METEKQRFKISSSIKDLPDRQGLTRTVFRNVHKYLQIGVCVGCESCFLCTTYMYRDENISGENVSGENVSGSTLGPKRSERLKGQSLMLFLDHIQSHTFPALYGLCY